MQSFVSPLSGMRSPYGTPSASVDSMLVDTSRIAKFSMVKFSDELQAARIAKFVLIEPYTPPSGTTDIRTSSTFVVIKDKVGVNVRTSATFVVIK